ncbi:hypothetical protein [Rubrobacter aplysinae]|uniref:hypothetical protein n=1 Tax=Rubrobacter aplysinae TaxID=909625 RepID=UPI00128DFD33|nr:hypothetical protein [Rubrobacter aplysinae]
MYGMPDTTTSNGRRVSLLHRRSNLLLVLAAVSVTFMLFSPHIIGAQENDQEDDGSCPGATVVDTFSGNGSQTTPVFQTTGESFRISYDATAVDSGSSVLTVLVNGEGSPISAVSQQGAGSGESFVNEGAGSYSLDINSIGLQYDITVEDCTGGAGGDQASVDPPGNIGQVPSEDQYEDTDRQDQTQQTPNTGGPPLSVIAVGLLWSGVFGLILTRKFVRQ